VAKEVITIPIPDLGGASDVEVVETLVSAGDEMQVDDVLIVLETDKASMEIPSPVAGTLLALEVKEGDLVAVGDKLATFEVEGKTAAPEHALIEPESEAAPPLPETAPSPPIAVEAEGTAAAPSGSAPTPVKASGAAVHAGPAVRKIAREFGVQLDQVAGSGPSGRIVKDDIQAYVKAQLQPAAKGSGVAGGPGIPLIPDIDFSQFGSVRVEPMAKLHKITATNMHRSWLNVPRVTQFDDADITELETFRSDMKSEAQASGVKLTPMPFILKACALALVNNPAFNASLHSDAEQIIYKEYVHIGMAVATPAGLMVPVIRDVDKKGLYELAAESITMAQKAKDRKLKPQEMQGGCFTISSLGGIGGTGFTPIVNAPEVAILGVSKLSVKPVWNGTDFVPRKMLPLALAYDHRAVNGADAGKFMTELVALLSDIRRLLL
jgi:pyruvate dehydrogenase E2 component (dihydrolipoamide acetyltransferase)